MAGMVAAFTYFYFRETGVQISWKDFVHYFLSRGLVGVTSFVHCFSMHLICFRPVFFDQAVLFSSQVDHLEVINKQYVKVIPAQGVNSSEVVSYGGERNWVTWQPIFSNHLKLFFVYSCHTWELWLSLQKNRNSIFFFAINIFDDCYDLNTGS